MLPNVLHCLSISCASFQVIEKLRSFTLSMDRPGVCGQGLRCVKNRRLRLWAATPRSVSLSLMTVQHKAGRANHVDEEIASDAFKDFAPLDTTKPAYDR